MSADLVTVLQQEAAGMAGGTEEEPPAGARSGQTTGGEFIFSAPAEPVSLWGSGNCCAHADGEGTLIFGPSGVGKSTVAQRYLLGRLGIGESELLEMPIRRAELPIVYLAMDRPVQIARSFRRMVCEEDRQRLDEMLHIWRGPLPIDIEAKPSSLATWLTHTFGEVGELVVDSYKDLGPSLAKDEGGKAINNAMQHCVVQGINWLGCHHGRKGNVENQTPRSLDDVYGSTWLTAGVGSVLCLWGEPGGQTSEITHLKQPAEDIGPITVAHDRGAGSIEALDMGAGAGRTAMQKQRRAEIVILLRKEGPKTKSELRIAGGWSRSTVDRDIEVLTEQSVLATVGDKGRETLYGCDLL